MPKNWIIFGFCLTITSVSYSQERELSGAMFDDLEVTHSLTKAYKDSVIKFHVKLLDDAMSLEEDKRYYWFNEGDVKSTVGNFTGKLLHGKYEKFDRSGNLIQKGSFRYGLREGVWNSWNKNGTLVATTNWKKGYREGAFKEYFENGQLMKQGSFKKNKLNGVFVVYDQLGVQVSSIVYDEGKPKEPRKPKVKKVKVAKEKRPENKKASADSTTKKENRKIRKVKAKEKSGATSN